MNATAIGDSRYDDRLDESTSAGFREKPVRHRTGLPRSCTPHRCREACRPRRASPTTSSSASASSRWRARNSTKNTCRSTRCRACPWIWRCMARAPVRSRSSRPRTTIASSSACAQFPRWADGAIALMRAGMSNGITLPRVAMAKVAPQLREIGTDGSSTTIFSGRPSPRCPRRSPRKIASASATPTKPRSPEKCCPPTRGSRISSSTTIYRPRAPPWAGAICPTARPGIAGASARRPPWTCRRRRFTSWASRKSRAFAARCSP